MVTVVMVTQRAGNSWSRERSFFANEELAKKNLEEAGKVTYEYDKDEKAILAICADGEMYKIEEIKVHN